MEELQQRWRRLSEAVSAKNAHLTEDEINRGIDEVIQEVRFMKRAAFEEELQQRFAELETQLERHANKAKHLRDQGLTELAEREDQRWAAVSREYVAVGNQIEDQRHKPAPNASTRPAGYTEREWNDYCEHYGGQC